jgi:hypothetical protein
VLERCRRRGAGRRRRGGHVAAHDGAEKDEGDDDDDDGSGGGGDGEARPNVADSGESLFVQYLALACFPEADYVCSDFHAGQGQVTFGLDRRERADCLVSVPAAGAAARELRFFNYHGLAYHGDGLHLSDCPRRDGGQVDEEEEDDDDDDKADSVDWVRNLRLQRRRRRRRQQLRRRRRSGPEVVGRHDGPSRVNVVVDDSDDDGDDDDDRSRDALKADYAQALTRVDPTRLAVRYGVVHECDLLHRRSPLSPETIRAGGDGAGRGVAGAGGAGGQKIGLARLLRRNHAGDAVLGCPLPSRLTQAQLVERILRGGFNVDGSDFGGFVTVTGGRETRVGDGVLPGQFGFCHQRCAPAVFGGTAGEFTEMQAELQEGSPQAGRIALTKLLANEGTMSRTSVHGGGETYALDYFRFLYLERGFRDFTVAHLVFYRHKPFLTEFLRHLLQLRHDLRRRGGSKNSLDKLKLVINGIYGERERERVWWGRADPHSISVA